MEGMAEWNAPFSLRCKVEAGKAKVVCTVKFDPSPGVVRFEEGIEELPLKSVTVLTIEKGGCKSEMCFFCFFFFSLFVFCPLGVEGMFAGGEWEGEV